MKRLTPVLLTALLVALPAHAQQIVDWTEGPGTLGLGYPVPVPVDTPEPFDGFRTYNGLYTRHQDLMMTRDNIVGEIVGQTRLDRDIWAYRIGDEDGIRPDGRAEPALLFNGGIHAREWQSPEVVTGFMEWLAGNADDAGWGSYLRDHVNVVLLPVNNIDGFLQTQRYPRSNYLGSDPSNPEFAPRDGRMRRKNLRGADENLDTAGDHLQGVDLNRNNNPYYPGPPRNSVPEELLYHGPSPGSEPETQALYTAATLAPESELRFFSDMHSFGRLLFSVRTGNTDRNQIQGNLMSRVFLTHQALPGGVVYTDSPDAPGVGIGTTSEYFANTYQIPSLTWEIEPGGNGAVEYGGLGNNGHDGFILPEDEIARVRRNLSETMGMVAFYMAGPPAVRRAEITDAATGALVWQAEWVADSPDSRSLDSLDVQPIEPGRDYRLRVSFDKPMRIRDDSGEAMVLPGLYEAYNDTRIDLETPDGELETELGPPEWQDSRDNAVESWDRYRDDTVVMDLRIADTQANRDLIQARIDAGEGLTLGIEVRDLAGLKTDVDPSTPADWSDGRWTGYEDHFDGADFIGGEDRTLTVPVTLGAQPEPAVVIAGHSAMWRDPARTGAGIMLDLLDDGRAVVYWFTYDEQGNQRWLFGVGEVHGNRVRFPEMFVTSGGRFGSAFDPDDVVAVPAVDMSLIFTGCDRVWLEFEGLGRRDRYLLHRLSSTMDIDCDPPDGAVSRPEAAISGSWRDPGHTGEGWALHWLSNDTILLTWYTYDDEGNQRWMIDVGEYVDGELVFDSLLTTRGGTFGPDFDPGAVESIPWGELRLTLDCETGGVAEWTTDLPEFADGSLANVERITELAGLECPTAAE